MMPADPKLGVGVESLCVINEELDALTPGLPYAGTGL